MVEVIMPKMGDAMEEGTLVEWTKKDGDQVKSGDVIGNIQTDKATVELTAPSSGTLTGFLIREGDTVPVGQAIAAILKEGEKLPEGWGRARKSEPQTAMRAEQPIQEQAKPEAAAAVAVAEQPRGERIFASPLARHVASEAGVELSSVKGTGPNGRIVERDVRLAVGTQPARKTAEQRQDAVSKLNVIRKITAERTAHSMREVPHYYVTVEVNLDSLEQLRAKMREDDPDLKLSINDFVVKACAMALHDQPHINASFDSNQIRVHGAINIGVAVALPDGLTMPVLKNCETKSVRQLAAEMRELAERAKQNKLSPDELTGSTFAISNMGMFDVESFTAIINEPNGAILAVSTAKKRPVVAEGDAIEVRTMMKITGSFDHRIIDGAVGAQFMGAVRQYLEAPTRLLS